MKKIAVVGAGRVGESCALFLAQKNLSDEVVLLDIRGEYAVGTALDIQQTAPVFGFDTRVTGGGDFSLMKGAGCVVVTAGFPRKPGMSRSDVLESNMRIVDSVCEHIANYASDAHVFVVSNPVDIMTFRAFERLGWPRERVFGQAGVLDASRMATFLQQETGLSSQDITAMVLGGHGDSMVPMTRFTVANGVPITAFLDQDRLTQIIDRTRHGGAEILKLKEISSAYQAPAASTVAMVEAVVQDRKRLLPTVAVLQGEYGCQGLAVGVPAILGRGGMEKIVELSLEPEEQNLFDKTVAAVQQDLKTMSAL